MDSAIKYGHVCCYLGNPDSAHNSRNRTLYHRDVIEIAVDRMDGWLLAQCPSRLESIYPVVRPLQSIGDGYMVLKRPDPYLFDQGHARDPTKQRTQHMKWPVSSTG